MLVILGWEQLPESQVGGCSSATLPRVKAEHGTSAGEGLGRDVAGRPSRTQCLAAPPLTSCPHSWLLEPGLGLGLERRGRGGGWDPGLCQQLCSPVQSCQQHLPLSPSAPPASLSPGVSASLLPPPCSRSFPGRGTCYFYRLLGHVRPGGRATVRLAGLCPPSADC